MNAAAWVALAGAVVASAAGLAGWVQVRAMREQTELQREIYRDSQTPYVWVDWRLDPLSAWVIELVVKNEGPTVARNVKIEFDPPLARSNELTGSTAFASLGAFTQGITSLPPGREMCWTLGSHVRIAEEESFGRHHVKISYDTVHGHQTVAYDLDYGDGDGTAIRDGGTIKKLTEAVQNLTQAVARP